MSTSSFLLRRDKKRSIPLVEALVCFHMKLIIPKLKLKTCLNVMHIFKI
uniref:RH61539p n=1 Tax=Drosophila melanogaster TaxID=7227 RepID=Q8SXW0_DROME|nr:RH61539p [Drosophila melanogaster]